MISYWQETLATKLTCSVSYAHNMDDAECDLKSSCQYKETNGTRKYCSICFEFIVTWGEFLQFQDSCIGESDV